MILKSSSLFSKFIILPTCLLLFQTSKANPAATEQKLSVEDISSGDLTKIMPYAPKLEKKLSPEMLESIKVFNSSYQTPLMNAGKNGLKPDHIKELENFKIKYRLVDTPEGKAYTRTISLDHESNKPSTNPAGNLSFNGDIITDIYRCLQLYGASNEKDKHLVEEIYRGIVKVILKMNLTPIHQPKFGWIGNGYTWRNRAHHVVRMAHTLPAKERDALCLTMFNYSGGSMLLGKNPYASTDITLNLLPTAFKALRLVSDSPQKWQILQLCRRGLDLSFIGHVGNSRSGIATADGGIIHHGGYHFAYGSYSFPAIVGVHRVFTRAKIFSPHTERVVKRFRKYAVSWHFTTPSGHHPLHMQMRSQFTNSSPNPRPAHEFRVPISVAGLTQEFTGKSWHQDLEMAYMCIAKVGEGSKQLPEPWRNIKLPVDPTDSSLLAYSLRGSYAHPVNGVLAHRHAGNYASIRGVFKFRRGGEAYAPAYSPTYFHYKAQRGSLIMLTKGKNSRYPTEWDSGYRLAGWNQNYYPNVTTVEDAPHSISGHKRPGYSGSGEKVMSSVSLGKVGFWMANVNRGTKKSALFDGARIHLATTNIHNPKFYTCLTQQCHAELDKEPFSINGKQVSAAGEVTIDTKKGLTMLDAKGDAFIMPPAETNPALTVWRGSQLWAYRAPLDKLSGSSTRAFLKHSNANKQNHSLFYTAIMQPSKDELAKLKSHDATQGWKRQLDPQLHKFHHPERKLYALAQFSTAGKVDHGQIISTSRPGAYLWLESDTEIDLTFGSSDHDNKAPFVIVLNGKWKVKSILTDDTKPTVSHKDNITTLTTPFYQEAPHHIKLQKL